MVFWINVFLDWWQRSKWHQRETSIFLRITNVMDCELSRKMNLPAAWPLLGEVYIGSSLPRLDGATKHRAQVEHSSFLLFLLSCVYCVENYHWLPFLKLLPRLSLSGHSKPRKDKKNQYLDIRLVKVALQTIYVVCYWHVLKSHVDRSQFGDLVVVQLDLS